MTIAIAFVAIIIGVFLFVYIITASPQSHEHEYLHELGQDIDDHPTSMGTMGYGDDDSDGGFTDTATAGWGSAAPAAQSFDFRSKFNQSVGKKFERSDRGSKLVDQLAKADLKIRPAEWTAITFGVAVAVGALAWLRFGSPLGFIIGGFLGWFACGFFLKFRAGKRKKAFDQQLPGTILSLSNGVKAGYTLAQAMSLVAQNSAEPMSIELGRVVREAQLGIPFIEAFGHMVERSESEDLKLMMTAVQIQQQVGGNLAQILDSIEFTIRERIRIKGEIKSITGQARASGWILIILPFALGGILFIIAPAYFDPMISTVIGYIMLGIGGLMLAGGYAIIRKIVKVEV